MMNAAVHSAPGFARTRDALETYFDRTAQQAWIDLTSDVKVSGIRKTVRAGRDRMRAMLLSWLPDDLNGARLLDAGCGTGALAIEAARRGASVLAIDISRGLVSAGRNRAPADVQIDWRVGDFTDPALGVFDIIVAMDSLIHYRAPDMVDAVAGLGARADRLAFTFAPRTPALTVLHNIGKLFPRGDRAPRIEPVSEASLRRRMAGALATHRVTRSTRVSAGFYKSHALLAERA